MPLLWQAERINIYLAKIPLIYLFFFHVVAVLLAEPSDLYVLVQFGFSVVSAKRFLGSLPKCRDSNEWALDCQPWLSRCRRSLAHRQVEFSQT